MFESDEIRILLEDPHEFGEIDGAWGAGVAELAEDFENGSNVQPLILTGTRLAPLITAIRPGLRVHVSAVSERHDWIAQRLPVSAAFLDLLFLRGRVPGAMRVRRIRSYGLRSAILGCVLAQDWKAAHRATIADPFDEPCDDPRAWRRRAWIRSLETKVTLHADEVETPDEESAWKLREIVPQAPRTRIRAARPPHCASTPATGTADPIRIAVEASTRSSSANRVALRAIRGLVSSGGLGVHWLARRSDLRSTRARRDIRRWNLARHFYWEEEPWAQPPHLRSERWHLLIRTDPRPGARPLHVRLRGRGTKVIAPSAVSMDPGRDDLLVEWTSDSLEGLLMDLIRTEKMR